MFCKQTYSKKQTPLLKSQHYNLKSGGFPLFKGEHTVVVGLYPDNINGPDVIFIDVLPKSQKVGQGLEILH